MVSEVLQLNNEFLTHRDMSRVKRKAKQMYSKQSSEDFFGNSSLSGDGEQANDVEPMEDKRLKTEEHKETPIESFDEVYELFKIFKFLQLFSLHR